MHNRTKLTFWAILLLFTSLACQTLAGNSSPSPTQEKPTEAPHIIETDDTPSPNQTSEPTLEPTEIPETYNLSNREMRNVLGDVWDLVDQEYLYEDFNGVDWEAQYDIVNSQIDDSLSDQEFYYAISEMIYNLGDDHSAFLSPNDVADEEATYAANDDYVGIGIYVSSVPNTDRAVILLVMSGGPAEQAGLKEHDNILAADGSPVVDENGYLLDNLLGEEGTDVTVLVQTPGEEPREVTVTRATISGGLPVPHQVLTAENGKRIGYLIIPTFAESTIAEKVGDALQEMEDLDGLIIDNRMNEGGYDNIFADTLAYFVEGKVGAFVDRGNEDVLKINGNEIGNSLSYPIVVLVGTDTVSFGEVFAGVLQDLGRATIVGETTLGNVEILWGYDLNDGSRVWIAHSTFIPSNNTDLDWEADGIIPEIEAIASWHEVTVESDPAVQAAVELLAGE